jgi:serine/threonine protein kinase
MPNASRGSPPGSRDSDEEPHASHQRPKRSLNDYHRIRCLGEGSFGHVVEVEHHPTGKRFAKQGIEKFELFTAPVAVQKTRVGKFVKESRVRVRRGESHVERVLVVTDCGRIWLLQNQEDEESEINEDLAIQFNADVFQLRYCDRLYTIQIENKDSEDWKEIFESLIDDM